MNLEDAGRILGLEARVEELENKVRLLEAHTSIDYDQTIEKLREQQEGGQEVEVEEGVSSE